MDLNGLFTVLPTCKNRPCVHWLIAEDWKDKCINFRILCVSDEKNGVGTMMRQLKTSVDVSI